MAESKKPAPARKKATKRGPTKAAALKALGLTQDDLNLLKQVAEARKRIEEDVQETAERDAIGAVQTSAPAQVVEQVDPQAKSGETPDPDAPKYIRNLRGTDVGFRLERQQGPGKKRTELKPRGSRGDLVKLQPGDESDANLQTQIAYNVVEVISAEEAQGVISKQSTNAQQAVHPALAMLRNPKGEEYGQGSFQGVQEEQSYTVAHLDPAQMQGKIDDKTVARGNPVVRVEETQRGPLPNEPIVTDGFNPPQLSPDEIARQKNQHGPGAGLPAGAQVTIAPTQRT